MPIITLIRWWKPKLFHIFSDSKSNCASRIMRVLTYRKLKHTGSKRPVLISGNGYPDLQISRPSNMRSNKDQSFNLYKKVKEDSVDLYTESTVGDYIV